MKKRTAVVVCGLVVFMMLISCGKKEAEPDQANAGMESAQSGSESMSADETSNANKAGIKGQEVTVDQFKFTIPDDWTGNKDTQVWFPKTEDPNKPIPPHSFHFGARPLVGKTFDGALKQHIGTIPADKKSVKIGNLEGIKCTWQQGRYKSHSMFLLEKNPGVSIMYFFTCQAPESDFAQFEKTYQGILNSVSLK